MNIKKMKLNFNGCGPLFKIGEFIEPRMRVEMINKLPNFSKWFGKRSRHHEELKKFCGRNQNRRYLVRQLLSFLAYDIKHSQKDDFATSAEWRHWLKTIRPPILSKIAAHASSPHELWMVYHLVIKCIPEHQQYWWDHEKQIEEYYERALAGFLEVRWEFPITNPAT